MMDFFYHELRSNCKKFPKEYQNRPHKKSP